MGDHEPKPKYYVSLVSYLNFMAKKHMSSQHVFHVLTHKKHHMKNMLGHSDCQILIGTA